MKKTHKNAKFKGQRRSARYDIFFYKITYIKNIANTSAVLPIASFKGFFIFC